MDLDATLDRLARARDELAERHVERLQRARAAMNDVLLRLDALAHTAATARAFVLEGWLPVSELARLVSRLAPLSEILLPPGKIPGPILHQVPPVCQLPPRRGFVQFVQQLPPMSLDQQPIGRLD